MSSDQRHFSDLTNPIQRLRAFSGMTQTDLARLLDCAQSAVAQWESGARRPHRRFIQPLLALAKQAKVRLTEAEIYTWQPKKESK